jgi:hypothetical protein
LQAQCIEILARNPNQETLQLTLQALASDVELLQTSAVRALAFYTPLPQEYLARIVQVGEIEDVCDLLALTGTETVEDWVVTQIAAHTDRNRFFTLSIPH